MNPWYDQIECFFNPAIKILDGVQILRSVFYKSQIVNLANRCLFTIADRAKPNAQLIDTRQNPNTKRNPVHLYINKQIAKTLWKFLNREGETVIGLEDKVEKKLSLIYSKLCRIFVQFTK